MVCDNFYKVTELEPEKPTIIKIV